MPRTRRSERGTAGGLTAPGRLILAAGALAFLAGCPRPVRVPLEPLPMADATRIVNGNIAKIHGTLRAAGAVDGRLTLTDGRTGDFHVDGTLFYRAPRYVRFDLKRFGERKFLIGSNAEHYWYFDAEENSYRCGRHGLPDGEFAAQIPVKPDQIIDALGLTPIACEQEGSTDAPLPGEPAVGGDSRAQPLVRPVQRVLDDCQQVLFLAYDADGHLALEKEYWLDRYWPRLVRQVVFRDRNGVITMQSALGEYRPSGPDGLLLPHLMIADWPGSGTRLRFHVNAWKTVEDVGPDSVQFAAPPQCRDDQKSNPRP